VDVTGTEAMAKPHNKVIYLFFWMPKMFVLLLHLYIFSIAQSVEQS
jgi:hypothetical protein